MKHLYLDSYGAFLSVKNGMIAVRMQAGGLRQFAVREVQAIVMTKGTALSTDAILLAQEHDIPLMVVDAYTHVPLAQIVRTAPSGTGALRKAQADFCRSWAGYAWVAEQIARKIGKRIELLEHWQNKLEKRDGKDLDRPMQQMLQLGRAFWHWEAPNIAWTVTAAQTTGASLRGQEGTASRLFFECLKSLVPIDLGFEARRKRPAFDGFNVMLNYLYGMLYTQCQLSLHKYQLDNQMGILHADQYAKPVLVYDLVEAYRPWAEEVALQLVSQTRADERETWFDTDTDYSEVLRLNAAGKQVVIPAMLQFLNKRTEHQQKQVTHAWQLELDTQALNQRITKFAQI
jgi:CRISP-associated protein Cas1